MYYVVLTKQAVKDTKNLKAAGLSDKAKSIIELMKINPFAYPPKYEALVGTLDGMYSRRINRQHRFVYTVEDGTIEISGQNYDGIVKVLSMWTHYENV